ncbi:hypothetical protein DAPPUDRAFT_113794 [Daphnia pulex]|uniref:Uncharacterized protein n=1 Tax=Daphnia pulex TaxID=6669 RepID=E9HG44_DAPPU|nr:hypothetical protein DAPPUDRAFT_113794 [Daphnia pulex]|eukprot:EFX69287.1 hypothetical protein DAPPUDRAFT_113794 [Daphnia pulex]
MSHHFTIEDVFRNFVKVLHALRFIAAEITTGDVSEGVSFWLPLLSRQRITFLEMAFGESSPDFNVPECSQDDFRRVDSIDFYYNRYPGYAKYRNVFSFRRARFLWYAESGTDICYPVPGLGNLYLETFSAPSEVRLSIRDVRWQMEESARIEDFMRVYEARHLLTAQLRPYFCLFSSVSPFLL